LQELFSVVGREWRKLLIDIAVDDARGESLFLQRVLHPFGHHYGTVLSAGAAERNRQVALSFFDVVGNQIRQQPLHAAQKLAGLRKGLDVPFHLVIFARVTPQFRRKVRIPWTLSSGGCAGPTLFVCLECL